MHRRLSRTKVVTFNYYIVDMPWPTLPVKRVCYVDDITIWASGSKIPQLESIINSYPRDVGIYLKENSLLISAPKSTVTLFTPDIHQFHTQITIEDTQLPVECSPMILGMIMDPSSSFHKHCNYVTYRIDKRNNVLKALEGSSWGQDKETLLLTCNATSKTGTLNDLTTDLIMANNNKPTPEAHHSPSKRRSVVEKMNADQQEHFLDDNSIASYGELKVSVGQHLHKAYTHINVLPREDNILLYMYNLHGMVSRIRGLSLQMQ